MANDVVQTRHGGNIVRKTDANPEGKGANGFMLDWYRSEPKGLVAKPQRQVLAEFFTSMLVLSAHFNYKPVVGVPNFLYYVDGAWSLSLIAPDEWSESRRTGFVGVCILQRDMTWTIEPSENIAGNDSIADEIAKFYDAFAHTLDTDMTLEEILPFHENSMRYYQRLYANALSRSIRGAIILGDQRSINCRDWRMLLPRIDNILLAHKN